MLTGPSCVVTRGDQRAERLRGGVPLLDRVMEAAAVRHHGAAIGDVDVTQGVHRYAQWIIKPVETKVLKRLRGRVPLFDRAATLPTLNIMKLLSAI